MSKIKARKIKPGDIIGVSRHFIGVAPYDHFGIYVGNEEVIHFASKHGDFGDEKIQKTTLKNFIADSENLFTYDFPEDYLESLIPEKIKLTTDCSMQIPPISIFSFRDKVFTDFLVPPNRRRR